VQLHLRRSRQNCKRRLRFGMVLDLQVRRFRKHNEKRLNLVVPGLRYDHESVLSRGNKLRYDGDVLRDSFNTNTFDVEGKIVSTIYGANGQNWGFTYDAFGHIVEFSINGSYSRSPIGSCIRKRWRGSSVSTNGCIQAARSNTGDLASRLLVLSSWL
jgi:YD repeat-containing protein